MSCGKSHCSGAVTSGRLPVPSAKTVFSQTRDMIAPYRPGRVSAAHGTLCPLQRTLCLSTQQPNRAERYRKRDAVFGFVSRRLKKVQRFFDSNLVGYRANSLQPTASGTARQLNPAAKPFKTGRLQVTQLHSLYYEVYGNPAGQPAVVFHGGPGAGCYANHARFFRLDHYMVVLVDQRGCGRSTPLGCLEDNNTAALVQDFEALREALGIDKWLLFGGSWGVTLSLAYARAHSDRVTGIILRGICLMRPSEIQWMYGGGAGNLAPAAWTSFTKDLGKRELKNPLAAYHKRLISPKDAKSRDAAAKAWMGWEMSVGFGLSTNLQRWNGHQWDPAGSQPVKPPSPASAPVNGTEHAVQSSSNGASHAAQASQSGNGTDPAGSSSSDNSPAPGSISTSVAQAMLECHYSFNNAFLEDEPLLEGLDPLRSIPCIAVQGRLDFVCPPRTAYDLHLAWPEMELLIVPGAGHSMYNPGIQHELLQATDRMRYLAQPQDTSNRRQIPVQRARTLASR